MTAVQVTLPAGVVAGQMMQVTNPNTGTAMQFPVPAGAGPGSVITVNMP